MRITAQPPRLILIHLLGSQEFAQQPQPKRVLFRRAARDRVRAHGQDCNGNRCASRKAAAAIRGTAIRASRVRRVCESPVATQLGALSARAHRGGLLPSVAR